MCKILNLGIFSHFSRYMGALIIEVLRHNKSHWIKNKITDNKTITKVMKSINNKHILFIDKQNIGYLQGWLKHPFYNCIIGFT